MSKDDKCRQFVGWAALGLLQIFLTYLTFA